APDRAHRAAGPTGQRGPRRVRCVLDHRDAAAVGDVEDLVHATWVAAVVHDHDRLGRRAYRRLDIARIEGQVVLSADVAEDGRGADVADGIGPRDEVEGWDDDLVPWAAPDREERQVERGRPVGDRDRMPCAAEVGEGPLEL